MKKKIFFLISSLDKGGAESHIASLANSLKYNNFQITIIYFKGSGYWKNFFKEKKIKIIKIKVDTFLDFIKGFFELKKITENSRPDIMHCNLSLAEIYGYFLCLFCKIKFKFIVSKHLDSFFFEASNGKNFILKGVFLEKLILNKASKIIFISRAVKKYFLNKININKKKYSVIYYGLNQNFYKKIIKKNTTYYKKKLNIQKNDLIIGTVSRHVKQKSLDFLIKAFSDCYNSNKNLKLVLVGSGKLTNNLKALAISLNINHRITWIPHVQDVQTIINLFDIACLTSIYEGLGLFLLECQMLKKPVIASNIGAIPEVIVNNYNGYLFKVNDMKSFKLKINQLQNPIIRKKFGNNGIKLLSKKFNFKEMLSKYLKIYAN